MLAVTAQRDGIETPLNFAPVDVSIDANPGPDCADPDDRVRGFYSLHPTGANFVFADASVRFVTETIDGKVYRALSTMDRGEIAFWQ